LKYHQIEIFEITKDCEKFSSTVKEDSDVRGRDRIKGYVREKWNQWSGIRWWDGGEFKAKVKMFKKNLKFIIKI
jgi:hypothetical protein